MENDYSKELIQKFQQRQNTINKNLLTQNLFPNRANPIQSLAPAEEFFLKATYALRVGFLQEFTFLFAYIYSKQRFEKAVIDLEQQGYIKSQQSKDYGKYWVLTATALYYLTTDQKEEFKTYNLKDDSFPSSKRLVYYKVLNGLFCQRVFKQRTDDLMATFRSQEKEKRIQYQKEQFIKAYLFTNTKQPYTKEAALKFVADIWDKFEADEEMQTQYKNFVHAFKENAKEGYVNHTMLQFAFLKDYFNASNSSREQSVMQTSKILSGAFQTVYRGNAYTSRIALYRKFKNEDIKSDLELFTYSELIAHLTMVKRNLSKTKPSDDEEAKLLSLKLDSLEKRIVSMEQTVSTRQEEFEVMVFDTLKNEIPMFKPAVITIKSLADIQCHIIGMKDASGSSRPLLIWGIFQPNEEDFSVTALFSRIERIYQYQMHHLPMADFKLMIISYSPKQAETIIRKLDTVKASFEDIGHYGLLLYHFDDIEVIATRQQMKERYEIFKEFKEKTHFEKSTNITS